MTGDLLAKEILAIRPDIPIVLCTGFSETISEKQAKQLGIREFVMKPLVIKILGETIRRAVDQGRER